MGLLVGNRVGGNGSKNRGAGGGLVSVRNKVCCIQHREVSSEGTKKTRGKGIGLEGAPRTDIFAALTELSAGSR